MRVSSEPHGLPDHAPRAGTLGTTHRDPFHRMLAARAMREAVPLVTADPVFAAFPVDTLW